MAKKPKPKPYVESIDPQFDDEDAAFKYLREVIDSWLILEQLNDTVPLVAASKLFQVLVDVMEVSMGRAAVRLALLMVNERSYDEPTTAADRQKIKDLVDQLSQARRKVEGKPALVMPGH